jgi:phosphate-selective porin OprO/OprP
MKVSIAALGLISPLIVPVLAQQALSASAEASADPVFSYGPRGLQYASADGNNFLWFGVRLQTRYSNQKILTDETPGAPLDEGSDIVLNRGRLKLGGHLIRPAFTVYSEYDFTVNRLLDLRATYQFTDWLSIRAGQWKSEYNRERIDSSGAQQFVERSVVTPWFTIDRQKGLMASGRFGKGQPYDSSYWFGRVSGAGRGGDLDDADGFWVGRYQWNFTKTVLPFSQSDITRRKPAGSVAAAFVKGKSAYTSFSSAGGGQLPGFTDGLPGQYQIEQFMLETAYQSGGLSWQQELHWKRVNDRVNAKSQRLVGIYLQTGYFFHERWQGFPEPLELAVRYTYVDPNRELKSDYIREGTIVANWFFNGHRNKLTADLSRVRRNLAPETDSYALLRLQWEFSF